MCLGTGVPKVKGWFHASNEKVPNERYDVIAGAEGDTKLACCKAMCFGTGAPKEMGCRRQHKACMLQGNVLRHKGVEGELRHEGAEGEGMPKATQSLNVWLSNWVPTVLPFGRQIGSLSGAFFCCRQIVHVA
ncbi:hypothetical protein Pyn_35288 [Prunus yedoensis var. nudiflora]|uniref:Uncharacterized protein n=1 Tax=Prunus yedoensis var. nudiflora TaxID=2094558 RepID=A0A314ZEI4_PRUYE|nr:hypothetical protein Pyn_35288 [Prunus yedoensis var. nudiflora]